MRPFFVLCILIPAVIAMSVYAYMDHMPVMLAYFVYSVSQILAACCYFVYFTIKTESAPVPKALEPKRVDIKALQDLAYADLDADEVDLERTWQLPQMPARNFHGAT